MTLHFQDDVHDVIVHRKVESAAAWRLKTASAFARQFLIFGTFALVIIRNANAVIYRHTVIVVT